MGWNWLDGVVAGIVAFSVLTAALKGFVRELIALAAVVAGLVIAALGYQRASIWFDDLTRSHEVALGLGFLALFVAVLVLGALVSALAKKLIQRAGVQWFDRFLGGVFGLVRGVIIASILLMTMLAFGMKPQAVESSTFAPYVATGARVIVSMMPRDLKAQFKEGFEKFRQVLADKDKKAIKN
jgi:membrane protein required for colicin V production